MDRDGGSGTRRFQETHALIYVTSGLGTLKFLFIVFRPLISKTLIWICLEKFMYMTLRI